MIYFVCPSWFSRLLLTFFSENSYEICASSLYMFFSSVCRSCLLKVLWVFAYYLSLFFVFTTDNLLYNSLCPFVYCMIFCGVCTLGSCHPRFKVNISIKITYFMHFICKVFSIKLHFIDNVYYTSKI